MVDRARVPRVGLDVVVFCDSKGQDIPALVGCVFGDGAGGVFPCINIAFMAPDPNREDSYGRQVDRSCTSVPHGSDQRAHGFYWRWEDEEPNVYVAPNPA